jgi:thiol-disulfide isomerase/thioredoxin
MAQPTPTVNAAPSRQVDPFKLELTAITGGEWSSVTERGKPLLVMFFSSWCERCFLSLRQLNAMMSKPEFKDHFGVVGVLMDEQTHKAVAEELTVGAPVVFPVLRSSAQFRASMKQELTISGVPSACLLDASGHIVESFEGSPPVAYLVRRAMISSEESE